MESGELHENFGCFRVDCFDVTQTAVEKNKQENGECDAQALYLLQFAKSVDISCELISVDIPEISCVVAYVSMRIECLCMRFCACAKNA